MARFEQISRNFLTGYTFVNTEGATLVAAMTTPPGPARQAAMDTLIGKLKSGPLSSSNLWAGLDLFQVYAAHDVQAAGLNWIDPTTYNAALVNNPTFSVDRGFSGNGTNSYISTAFIPANGVQIAQNDTSFSLWSRTSAQQNLSSGGVSNTNRRLSIQPRSTIDVMPANANEGTGVNYPGVTDGSGLFTVIRTGASATVGYRNATSLGTGSGTSTGLPTVTMFIGAFNNGGAASSFNNRQYAICAFGKSRTATEEQDFYNACLAYLQSMGAA